MFLYTMRIQFKACLLKNSILYSTFLKLSVYTDNIGKVQIHSKMTLLVEKRNQRQEIH